MSNVKIKTKPNKPKWTSEEIMKVARTGSISISPRGKKILYTRAILKEEENKFLTHIYMTDADGKNFLQLTEGEYSCTNPRWSPDGKLIAFLTSSSGKQNIWLIRGEGGEAWQITHNGVNSFIWSPDGRQIAFIMTDPPAEGQEKIKNEPAVSDKDIKMNHLWLTSVSDSPQKEGEVRRLTCGNFNVGGQGTFGDWSPDGKTIVFTHTQSPCLDDIFSSNISKLDIETGTVSPVISTEATVFSPLYSPDGKWIAFISSVSLPKIVCDYHIYIIPAEGGKACPLSETFNHNMILVGWSEDSRYIYFIENRGTSTVLSAMPIDGNPPVDIINDEKVITGVTINKSHSMIGFSLQSLTGPPEVYISELQTIKPVKISRVNEDFYDYPSAKTSVIKWKSIDGMEIEGLLTYPASYKKGKKYPLLLIIHGGTTGIFVKDFIGNRNVYPVSLFASKGFAVLRCNIRGSDGYGINFRKATLMDLGGMDYQDLMSGVDYVINMGVADENRLGVMGWSYGGYMTAWVITHTGRFKAASVGAGPVNLVSIQSDTDLKMLYPDYFGCQPWENPELYMERSPISHIKGVTTPTLILHGGNDTTVPVSQGHELYSALRRQKVPVELIICPGSRHIISEPDVLVYLMTGNLKWFKKYV